MIQFHRGSVSSQATNLRFLILDAVSFVYHHVPPVELLKGRLFPENHLVGSDNSIPLPCLYLLLNNALLKKKLI